MLFSISSHPTEHYIKACLCRLRHKISPTDMIITKYGSDKKVFFLFLLQPSSTVAFCAHQSIGQLEIGHQTTVSGKIIGIALDICFKLQQQQQQQQQQQRQKSCSSHPRRRRRRKKKLLLLIKQDRVTKSRFRVTHHKKRQTR